MKRKIIIATVVVLLLSLASLGAVAYRVWQSNQQNATATDLTNSATVEVDIANFAYSPNHIKVKRGTKVIWTNRDVAAHTVTSDEGSELDSGSFGRGETFAHTFEESGRFSYFCEPHPFMKASVEVVD